MVPAKDQARSATEIDIPRDDVLFESKAVAILVRGSAG
jgi:hypothetical protein